MILTIIVTEDTLLGPYEEVEEEPEMWRVRVKWPNNPALIYLTLFSLGSNYWYLEVESTTLPPGFFINDYYWDGTQLVRKFPPVGRN